MSAMGETCAGCGLGAVLKDMNAWKIEWSL